jgi:GNAT superfamily N-acetyltransferase
MPLTLDHCLPWAELLAISFGRSADQTAQVLAWLHEVYRVTAWGAWDVDRLVAQYACLRRRVRIGGVVLDAGMSLNMSVHPDYRGRGLIKQVSQPVYAALDAEGAAFGFGFSNAEGVQVDRHSKGYGYQVVGRMVSTVAYLTPRRGVPPLCLSDKLPAGAWDVGDSGGISFEMSAESIRHRYARHPFRRYCFGIWEEGSAVLGVVVYRRHRWGAALLAAYGHDLTELLSRWSSALQAEGVRVVQALTTPNARLRQALAKISVSAALPYSRSPYYLTVKPLAAGEAYRGALLDFASWDCIGGDIL